MENHFQAMAVDLLLEVTPKNGDGIMNLKLNLLTLEQI